MTVSRTGFLAAMIVAAALLGGCKSTEEKAQEHYENAVKLAQGGDDARALVELQNVFKLNGQHHDARVEYARIEQERGNYQQAYGQYLRLVEQYPTDPVGLRELSRIALLAGDYNEAQRHLETAEAAGLVANDPVLQAIKVNLDYRDAVINKNDAARLAAAKQANQLAQSGDGAAIARRVVIDALTQQKDWAGALAAIDAGLKENPDDKALYQIRLGVLAQLGRTDEIETQLHDMIARFPDDPSAYQTLISLLLSQGREDDVEAFLRSRIEPSSTDAAPAMQLVQFLAQRRGGPAAIDELNKMIAQDDANKNLFRAARAGLEFDSGDREAGISELESVVKETTDAEQLARFRIALAKMYIATNNPVGARALVEEVLKDDATDVEALKLRAGWLIDDDKPGDALVDLNSALDQSPRDPDIFTLMARAHQRAGNTELVKEMLGKAVDASANAPAESLRYAYLLRRDKQLAPAEDVLITSLKRNPDNVQILGALGQIYVEMKDRPRLDGVVNALDKIDTTEAKNWSNELTAQMLSAENRGKELDSFLENLAQSGQGNIGADVAVIRRRLAEGDAQGALDYVNGLLEKTPDSTNLQFVKAGVLASTGKFEEAEKLYLALKQTQPNNEALWLALYGVKLGEGQLDAASGVLDEALVALPDSANLKWAKAGQEERAGNVDAAIAIYEDLYKSNPNSVVVANNLASLISSYDTSDNALERAYNIARRLRDTKVPAFQDTYGWIAERLGNHDEALEYLEPAAVSLPKEPLAHYHLGVALASLGRNDEALASFKRAEALLADRPEPSYLANLKSEIARLESGAATGTDGSGTE